MNAGRLSGMTFKHIDIDLPHLNRETVDGVRYYKIPDEDELLKLVSITSITSHFNKEIFINWRKRVGTEQKGEREALVLMHSCGIPYYPRPFPLGGRNISG